MTKQRWMEQNDHMFSIFETEFFINLEVVVSGLKEFFDRVVDTRED